MRYLLVILLAFIPSLALAQDEDVGPATECAAVLAAPPFEDILTRNEGRDFSEINPLYSGQELLGLECNIDDLTEFFEDAGWEFLGFEDWKSAAGPVRGNPGNPEYYVDASASYCLKRPTIGRFFPRCRPLATITFHEGQISHLIVYASK